MALATPIVEPRVEQYEIKGCPVDHTKYSRKTKADPIQETAVPITKDGNGVWHVNDYQLVKQILRSKHVRQAGFASETAQDAPQLTKPPILFLDGKEHAQQRKLTAPFFTPKRTQSYRQLMLDYADKTIAQLKQNGRANLSDMTMEMAVLVAGQIVGLPDNDIPGLSRRISRLIEIELPEGPWSWKQVPAFIRGQIITFNFYFRDVRPAIKAREANPQEDVISHLLAQDYKGLEVLVECVTFGAAGMVTTREFIAIAFLHLMENDEIRERYLASEDEQERHQILHEVLRLEPVVSNLYRRATADFELETADEIIEVKAGELFDLNIYAANADETAVGDDPHDLCPARDLAHRVPEPVMSFGDGAHRCPGAYVAIQESDIFLQKLLRIEGLRIESKPEIKRNELIKSYELENFIIAVD